MGGITQKDVAHALEILDLTLPTTREHLERAKRVQLYNWNPSRYANLTNNPAAYMQAYKKAEDMTKRVEAAYALLGRNDRIAAIEGREGAHRIEGADREFEPSPLIDESACHGSRQVASGSVQPQSQGGKPQ